jgi:multicomponent Na+:H+ antiporter subunit D
LLVGALLALVLPDRARPAVLAAPALAAGLAWALPDGGQVVMSLLGRDLVLARVDGLARPFAVVFALLSGLGALYSLGSAGRRLHAAGLAAAGAALGVVLAGDWVTLYIAWEALALASFVLILDGTRPRTVGAAFRYLLVHLAGGTLLLAGIAWHLAGGGEARVGTLGPGGPALFVLIAFAINAAIPPLHAWLTDAYPESSPAGTVFLSAFATKAAVYALARVFPGEPLLVWAGVAMALYGVVFAVLENDIRRLLGYHIVSQVGYMVAGVGLGTGLAISGATAHAFAHILYKGLLLMGAGAVAAATGRSRLTELGGIGRAMPFTLALYMVGALSISGAPLLNGFVSKSLVVAAAEAEHRVVVAWLLNLASVGTFLHTGLKLPWFTFAGPARGGAPQPIPVPMHLAMALTAGLCALTGTVPSLLYALLPYPVTYEPYTTAHVLESVGLLAGTAVGFFLLARHLGGEPTVTLDADRLYRGLGRLVSAGLAPAAARAADLLEARADTLAGLRLGRARASLAGPVGYAVMLAVAVLGAALFGL